MLDIECCVCLCVIKCLMKSVCVVLNLAKDDLDLLIFQPLLQRLYHYKSVPPYPPLSYLYF